MKTVKQKLKAQVKRTAKKPYILRVFNACLIWDFVG